MQTQNCDQLLFKWRLFDRSFLAQYFIFIPGSIFIYLSFSNPKFWATNMATFMDDISSEPAFCYSHKAVWQSYNSKVLQGCDQHIHGADEYQILKSCCYSCCRHCCISFFKTVIVLLKLAFLHSFLSWMDTWCVAAWLSAFEATNPLFFSKGNSKYFTHQGLFTGLVEHCCMWNMLYKAFCGSSGSCVKSDKLLIKSEKHRLGLKTTSLNMKTKSVAVESEWREVIRPL